MAKCPHNKNVSSISTNLVDTGIEEDVASLVASTLISRALNIDHEISTSNHCNVNDNTQRYTSISVVNMEDDICNEAEEAVITSFLQFALDNTEKEHQGDMNTIDCNHIRIGTFVAENEEPLALCADTGTLKSVIGKKAYETYT